MILQYLALWLSSPPLQQEDYYAAEIKEEIIEDVVDSEGNQAGRTDHNLDYDAQLAPFKSEGNSRDSIPGHTSSAEYSDPQYEHLNPSSMQTNEMNPGPSEIIEVCVLFVSQISSFTHILGFLRSSVRVFTCSMLYYQPILRCG